MIQRKKFINKIYDSNRDELPSQSMEFDVDQDPKNLFLEVERERQIRAYQDRIRQELESEYDNRERIRLQQMNKYEEE